MCARSDHARLPSPLPAPTAGKPWARASAAALAGLLGAWVFLGALPHGFAQDDWSALARATGLATPLPFGWRWLSHQAFWDFVAGPLAMHAAAAHAVVLGLHAASTALLVFLLSRRLGTPAALVGGVFFASHFAQYTACSWLSANGDVAATLLALVATALFLGRGRHRWLALPVFAMALAAKESVLAWPLALALLDRGTAGPARDRRRDPLLWALATISLAWLVLLRVGTGAAALGGEAYALSMRSAGPNLLTYAGWTLNAWLPTVRDVSERVTPGEFAWGALWLGAGALAAWLPATRRRGAGLAAAAYVLLLLPVLPLAAHTYHYYLVVALPAAAWLVGAIADAVFAKLPARAAWSLALMAALALAFNGRALATRIATAPFRLEGLHADPVVNRAGVAERALDDLRAAHLPAHSVVRLWSPQSQAMSASEGVPAEREGYYELNLRISLQDGLAVRVALPQVESARFVRRFDPADSLAYWAVCRYDGRLRVMRGAELARLLESSGQ